MTKRTFQILMVAAAIWVTTPSTAQAATLNFTPGTFVGDSAIFGSGATQYEFGLVFDLVTASFSINLTSSITPTISMPPGYVCVPIDGTNCIQFTATPVYPAGPQPWTGNYTLTITWQADTNPSYPNSAVNPALGRIRILHSDSSGVSDITIPGSYCTTCVVDPAIGGKDDNFSDFIVVQAPTVNPNAAVPEPATMVLLGSGLAMLAVRLRRNRRSS